MIVCIQTLAKHMRDPNKRKRRERREWQKRRAWWKGIKTEHFLYVCTLDTLSLLYSSTGFVQRFEYFFLFAVGALRENLGTN